MFILDNSSQSDEAGEAIGCNLQANSIRFLGNSGGHRQSRRGVAGRKGSPAGRYRKRMEACVRFASGWPRAAEEEFCRPGQSCGRDQTLQAEKSNPPERVFFSHLSNSIEQSQTTKENRTISQGGEKVR